MAENVRLGNEEEEALHHEGDGDDNDGFRGRGGERGRWTWREEGEEVYFLVIVISIIHSNNTYFASIPIQLPVTFVTCN